ncbi:hypothetical protein FFB58_14345 [Enterobacter sp. MF024]|uniref:Uncharacterized protein n=1 Tax=Leclercia barmai TaxID=2785629 RepID=A0ABS7RVY6_9ENTR|nr:hypothetical protein [Leclercia sp. EMC7]QCZ26632.1 hypothetical protein FHN83_08330 [Leclercia adecarboxylata]TLU67060.1 hypothetical protein FFB58_14345 [Enterobacter sp. MF024]
MITVARAEQSKGWPIPLYVGIPTSVSVTP